MIFDYKSEKAKVLRKSFVMGCILSIIYKIFEYQLLDNFSKKMLQKFSFCRLARLQMWKVAKLQRHLLNYDVERPTDVQTGGQLKSRG